MPLENGNIQSGKKRSQVWQKELSTSRRSSPCKRAYRLSQDGKSWCWPNFGHLNRGCVKVTCKPFRRKKFKDTIYCRALHTKSPIPLSIQSGPNHFLWSAVFVFTFPFPFPLPFTFAFAVGRAVGDAARSSARKVGSAPRMRVRPSFSCSVIIGLAAGRNLYSFEYLLNEREEWKFVRVQVTE